MLLRVNSKLLGVLLRVNSKLLGVLLRANSKLLVVLLRVNSKLLGVLLRVNSKLLVVLLRLNSKLLVVPLRVNCSLWFLQEKSAEYDELKSRMQEQMIQSRANLSKESHELRVQLQQITEQLANTQAEGNRKDEQNVQLRYTICLHLILY